LQTHGIPTLGFPITEDGTVLRHLCREFWTKRRLLEDSLQRENAQTSRPSSIVPRIQTPNQNDVLLGRGKAFYRHIGNIRLRKLIIDNASVYELAPFSEKQRVSGVIVRLIHEQGGLFLKEDDAWWIEVDEETARNKVSNINVVRIVIAPMNSGGTNIVLALRFHTCFDPSDRNVATTNVLLVL